MNECQDDAPHPMPTGIDLLRTPLLNRGTAFTESEREEFHIRGLLPPRVATLETQAQRILENFNSIPDDLHKYIYILALEDRNETLFYRVVVDNLELMMPIIYTPTVGLACQEFGHIFQRPRGLFISAKDKGEIAAILQNWPHDNVRVIVVTDGERILGLGDLGANGMGIPVGKIALYTTCGGIDPTTTLPIMLDVGTNNESLLNDPLYIGNQERRLRGEAYDEFLEEFVMAVQDRFPCALLQFEDFANFNAFGLLEKYRDRICTFNDDIQGTASVALAGLYSAMRMSGGKLVEQKFLFLGAGGAGIGIADLIVTALMEEGLSQAEARGRCWFVDSTGLIVEGRERLSLHKQKYANEGTFVPTFAEAVNALQPSALIGVSGQPNTFTQPIIEAMTRFNERPIIFALSNPTANAECTAEQAYTWSQGRAIFASGSPFDAVTFAGQQFVPGQGNNAYIFPGVGLGVTVSGAKRVTEEMFLIAAKTLANLVAPGDLALGRVYPPLTDIRKVSAAIGAAVAEVAYQRDLAAVPRPDELPAFVQSSMYEPDYKTINQG